MTVIPALGVGVLPGTYFFWNQVLAPGRRAFIIAQSGDIPVGRPAAYVDIILAEAIFPSGGVSGRLRSILLTDVGVYIPGVPESSVQGGWFIGLYVVNQRNQGEVSFNIFLNQL
jgi:hypothetical protein